MNGTTTTDAKAAATEAPLNFAELRALGLAGLVDRLARERCAAEGHPEERARLATHALDGHAGRVATNAVDAYFHGDPTPHADVLDRLAEVAAAFGTVARALSTILACAEANPGTIKEVPTGHPDGAHHARRVH